MRRLARFFDFVGRDALIVGHNVPFDFRMLRNECEKFGREVDLESFAFCDTLRLARRLLPGLPCYSLATMIDALKLDGKNSHDYDEALVIRESQIKFRPELADKLSPASIAIAALLHDVCKAEVYKEVEKFRKDKDGKWEKYTTYGVDYSAMPLGHGEKSVIRLLRWGLELADDEILAIRWHMHAFDMPSSNEASGCFTAAGDKCPLLAVLIAADGLASRILETK